MNNTYKQIVKRTFSISIFIAFVMLSIYFFDLSDLLLMSKKLWTRPDILIMVVLVYFLSFCLKAWSWRLYLHKRPRFLSCLIGILYSLFVNHISPIKAGDLVRSGILSARDKHIAIEEALHSMVVLRLLDSVCLVVLAGFGLLVMDVAFTVPVWMIIAAGMGAGALFILFWKKSPSFISRQLTLIKSGFSGANGLLIFLLTFLSWVLEAAVLFGTATAVNQDLSFIHSVWANSVTVGGQIFQITPGGIANYETIMTFCLGILGLPMKEGYMIALITHSIKFIFSYTGGAFALYIFPVSLNQIKVWIKQKGVMRG